MACRYYNLNLYNRLAEEYGMIMKAMDVAFTRITAARREAIVRFVLREHARLVRMARQRQ